jgi:signal transduction histidine kinase
MSALARDTFDQLLELDSERRKIDFSVRPLPPALGTPSLIRQVWANLIGNALKFTRGREPTRIRIDAAHASDGSTVYSIEDNGVGFDMRHADKLFGVFQRLHSEQEIPGTSRPASPGRVASGPSSGAATAPVPRFEGTGVGLALVQRIIARHGGRVWAEARPGQGATFFFSLPNPEL